MILHVTPYFNHKSNYPMASPRKLPPTNAYKGHLLPTDNLYA